MLLLLEHRLPAFQEARRLIKTLQRRIVDGFTFTVLIEERPSLRSVIRRPAVFKAPFQFRALPRDNAHLLSHIIPRSLKIRKQRRKTLVGLSDFSRIAPLEDGKPAFP